MRKETLHTETELVKGFRLGHQQCFTQVFNLFYHALCFYAFKITHDQSAAEDIAEESFVRVWERKELFMELPVLKSYLYSTARNASLNWLKKNSKVYPLSEDIAAAACLPESDSFKYIVGAEMINKLSAAIEQLPAQGRQVIKMIFFEGKKTRAVAEELGVSASTVKTQKARSLSKLKKDLLS